MGSSMTELDGTIIAENKQTHKALTRVCIRSLQVANAKSKVSF